MINEILDLKKQLNQSHEDNKVLYDFSPMMYLTIDCFCYIQNLNFKASHFLKADRKTLIDTLFLNYMTEHSKQVLEKTIQTLCAVQFKQTCKIDILIKGGEKKNVTLKCTLLKNKLIGLLLIDTTYIQQLEAEVFELNKSGNTLHNIILNVSDAIAALDNELFIKIINQSFINLFSDLFSIKIQVDMNLAMILCDFPEQKNKIISACQKALLGNTCSFILENKFHVYQSYYCYEITVSPIYQIHNKTNELIVHVKNLTTIQLEKINQHKRLAALAIASRASAMGEIASAFAHEITQPLAAINAYSQSCLFILKNKVTPHTIEDKKRNNELIFPLEQITRQAENAGNIIYNMNNFMHDDVIMLEEDINLIIHEALIVLYYETLDFKLKISLDLMNSPPKIICNKTHIMQIILNLAQNSIDSLKKSNQKYNQISIRTRVLKNNMFVRVTDNGHGVCNKLKHLMLDSYFSTKPNSSGLGLRICRSLIEAHKGTFSLQKQRTNGARFTFTLPIQSVSAELNVQQTLTLVEVS